MLRKSCTYTDTHVFAKIHCQQATEWPERNDEERRCVDETNIASAPIAYIARIAYTQIDTRTNTLNFVRWIQNTTQHIFPVYISFVENNNKNNSKLVFRILCDKSSSLSFLSLLLSLSYAHCVCTLIQYTFCLFECLYLILVHFFLSFYIFSLSRNQNLVQFAPNLLYLFWCSCTSQTYFTPYIIGRLKKFLYALKMIALLFCKQ